MTEKPPAKSVAALATESARIRLLMKAVNQIYTDDVSHTQVPRVWPASYLDRVYSARMRAWTVSY